MPLVDQPLVPTSRPRPPCATPSWARPAGTGSGPGPLREVGHQLDAGLHPRASVRLAEVSSRAPRPSSAAAVGRSEVVVEEFDSVLHGHRSTSAMDRSRSARRGSPPGSASRRTPHRGQVTGLRNWSFHRPSRPRRGTPRTDPRDVEAEARLGVAAHLRLGRLAKIAESARRPWCRSPDWSGASGRSARGDRHEIVDLLEPIDLLVSPGSGVSRSRCLRSARFRVRSTSGLGGAGDATAVSVPRGIVASTPSG